MYRILLLTRILLVNSLNRVKSLEGIFETLCIIQGTPLRLESHICRMEASAAALSIPYSRAEVKSLILDASRQASESGDTSHRLRVDLRINGELTCTTSTFPASPPRESLIQRKIFWASDLFDSVDEVVTQSDDTMLRHKTFPRILYDEAWRRAEAKGGFDAIFVNEKGYVTEGGRTNIFFLLPEERKDNEESYIWITPSLSCGLLPGVMRSAVLSDSAWNAREGLVTVAEAMAAKDVIITNSLRGVMPAAWS